MTPVEDRPVESTGDPAVIVRLADGSVAAYDAVCTHQGCAVAYDAGSGLLLCPCHGAAFDPAHQAEAVGGLTNTRLPELPIIVDQATGKIYLQTWTSGPTSRGSVTRWRSS